MSVTPGVRALVLYEGSTLDRTATFYTDAAQTTPKNLTGWTARMHVRKDYGSDLLLEIASGTLTPGPSAKALVMGGAAGTVRIYAGSSLMAALNHSDFGAVLEDGETLYKGVWDLELTNPASEVFRYLMGEVLFSREVTVV